MVNKNIMNAWEIYAPLKGTKECTDYYTLILCNELINCANNKCRQIKKTASMTMR